MYLGVRHPRDGVRRDCARVAAGTVHVQAVALSDQAVRRYGAGAKIEGVARINTCHLGRDTLEHERAGEGVLLLDAGNTAELLAVVVGHLEGFITVQTDHVLDDATSLVRAG